MTLIVVEATMVMVRPIISVSKRNGGVIFRRVNHQ